MTKMDATTAYPVSKKLRVGTKVRIDPSDDDWPGRVGVVSQITVYAWVQFSDGEGGDYPPDMLSVVRD